MSCKQSRHERRRQILFLFRAATFFLVYITTTPTDSIAAEASWRTSAAPCERIVFQTGFEQNNLAVDISDFKLVDGVALKGRRSLMGQVTEAKQACFLPIPYTAREKRQVNVSFFVRTDNRSACAVFWRKDNARTKTSWTRVPNASAAKWTHVTCSHAFDTDEKGVIQIVAPSSFNAPAGRAWIDELVITESDVPAPIEWPDQVVDFPALAVGKNGTVYLATLQRPGLERTIGVYSSNGTGGDRFYCLEPRGISGISAPAVAPVQNGCLVVFGAEQNDRWRLAYAFINENSPGRLACRFIESGGVANISPALAVTDGRACVVWESNASGRRGIMACWIDQDGPAKVEQISDANINSYNPSIVALEEGSLFAAWDSAKDESIDIYGARWKSGKWNRPRRLTSDVRIERYPFLASWKNQVWIAWQAQSYNRISVNVIGEQKIVVARLDGQKLSIPVDLFEHLAKANPKLLRPRICFGPQGTLFITARQSTGQRDGWIPVLWTYSGQTWSGPTFLSHQVGRWRPVPLVWTENGCFAAVQFDDVPGHRAQQGINDDWHSAVTLVGLPETNHPESAPLQTELLIMPESEFSLSRAMDMVAADFPRQTMTHSNKILTLFWGDLHAHTDISICGRNVNQPGHDLFANRRDIEKLDFCALTDHGYDFDNPRWAYNGEQTRNNHDPGHFLTFLGQEWTSSKNPPAEGGKYSRYGHRNLVYLDPYYHRFHDSFDGDISPSELWARLDGVEFVCIPHQLADWKQKGRSNPPTDWTYHHEHHQPVAEIFQGRGSYEYLGCPRQAALGAPFCGNYLQDAWAKGIVIGTIASPDHGGGKGKAGVWAEEFTRQSIIQAIRARHTFGTSGAKMAMRLAASWNGRSAMMGDKVARPKGPIRFTVEGSALRDIREVVIFRNNEPVCAKETGDKEFTLNWTDPAPPDEKLLWYYARFQATDKELAWSSPIWFVK